MKQLMILMYNRPRDDIMANYENCKDLKIVTLSLGNL